MHDTVPGMSSLHFLKDVFLTSHIHQQEVYNREGDTSNKIEVGDS